MKLRYPIKQMGDYRQYFDLLDRIHANEQSMKRIEWRLRESARIDREMERLGITHKESGITLTFH